MADIDINKQEEAPLDPAAEQLRRKMLRLMVLSVGSMFIGIFAVLFAIVYKMNNAETAAQKIEASITLPDTFEIQETISDDDRLMLRGVDEAGKRSILIFDAQTGESRGIINID